MSRIILLLSVLLGFSLSVPVMAAEDHYAVSEIKSAQSVLVDGTTQVLLAGIAYPASAEPNASQNAAAFLQKQLLQKLVRLERLEEKADRRGRWLAAIYDEKNRNVQEMLLKEGLAIYAPDEKTQPFSKSWQAAEASARKAGKGLWGAPVNMVLPADQLETLLTAAGSYGIISGKVTNVALDYKRVYINFGDDWKTDFTLIIEPEARKRFDEDWLAKLTGKTLRARGWLHKKNGPAMSITYPEQMEILP